VVGDGGGHWCRLGTGEQRRRGDAEEGDGERGEDPA
jgi:hypothetical protein